MTTNPRRSVLRIAMAVVLGAAGLGAGAVVAPTSASAETNTVTVPFRCESQFFNVAYDELLSVPVTITTPDTVTEGDPIPVTYTLPSPPTSPPIALGNVVAHATPSVTAQKATGGPAVTASGLGPDSAATNVAPGTSYPVSAPVTMSIPTTSFAPGDLLRIRPSTVLIEVVSGDDGIGGGIITCTPEPTPPAYVTSVLITASLVPTADQCTADVGNVNTGSCYTTQEALTTILAGSLRQDATQTGINPDASTVLMGSVTSSTTGSTLNGVLNQIRVTDNRGGGYGWSLTASMTDLSTSGSKIMDNALLAITPTCAVSATGSAAGATAGAPNQNFGGTVSLCTGPVLTDAITGTTGGQWDVNAPLTLTVPPFQAAGAYSAILTVNLA